MTGLAAFDPPEWAAGYVGVPYVAGGRDRAEGLDCWGLVRLVLTERLGLQVPAYDDLRWRDEADDGPVGDGAGLAAGDPRWAEVAAGDERVGDVVLIRLRGLPIHVGVVVARGWMLHAWSGAADSSLDRYGDAAWRRRLLGFRRWSP